MCVLCNKASSLLRSDTWFFAGALIWYHTHKDTQHTRASRLTHPYKYIFAPFVICLQQPTLLHLMDNLMISKYFPGCYFFLIIIHLQRSYIFWLDAIRPGSSNNTGVSKQNTHIYTPNIQRKTTLERVS